VAKDRTFATCAPSRDNFSTKSADDPECQTE
jgi:hypothetical protein